MASMLLLDVDITPSAIRDRVLVHFPRAAKQQRDAQRVGYEILELTPGGTHALVRHVDTGVESVEALSRLRAHQQPLPLTAPLVHSVSDVADQARGAVMAPPPPLATVVIPAAAAVAAQAHDAVVQEEEEAAEDVAQAAAEAQEEEMAMVAPVVVDEQHAVGPEQGHAQAHVVDADDEQQEPMTTVVMIDQSYDEEGDLECLFQYTFPDGAEVQVRELEDEVRQLPHGDALRLALGVWQAENARSTRSGRLSRARALLAVTFEQPPMPRQVLRMAERGGGWFEVEYDDDSVQVLQHSAAIQPLVDAFFRRERGAGWSFAQPQPRSSEVVLC